MILRTNLLFLVCSLLFVTSVAYADMYKYVDDTGSVVITNSIESVPKKYRTSMKVIKEEIPLSQQKLLPEVQKRKTDPTPSTQSIQTQRELQKESQGITADSREKYINTGFVLVAIIAGYFIMTRLTGSLGFTKIGMIAFLFLVLTGGVYLYNLYLKEMSAAFSVLRKDALGMKKNIETRENKTEQMLNKLPGVE